ncbi:MAG: glycosyltransferase [Planctomycetota bacterium]|nr:glycosyltransferase [Planctomycetota bacterium]
MTAPRVLHLFANYKWTGPADPAIRAAARLRGLGLDVRFTQAEFVHRGGEHRVAEELKRWGLPEVRGLELRKHFHVPSLLRDVRELRFLVEEDGYDILHCHQGADHLLASLAVRRLARRPVVIRSLYEPEAPRRGWRQRAAFKRTQAVLAPTARAQQGVQRRFAVPSARVLLQDPVTEPRDLDGANARARFKLADDHLVVGITARVQPHRRFELLWDVVAEVARNQPKVRFVLLGRGNERDMRQLVHEPIQRAGIQEHVVLPGYQKGAAYEEALRALDVFFFLVPGSDGTCRAVCDAMAFGLPVVATRRGILPELVAARRAGEVPGYAVEESAAALSGALLGLLGDGALRARCGAAALRRSQLDMDPSRAAERTRALYQELLEERR